MDVLHPDTLEIPFLDIYRTWFSEIRNLNGYGNRRVCLKELYILPNPGVGWVWDGWRTHRNFCLHAYPSALYQSFNLFLRDRWESRIPQWDTDNDRAQNTAVTHIVICVRGHPSVDEENNDKNSVEVRTLSLVRVIENFADMVSLIRSLEGVKVTVKDFSTISYQEQVALVKEGCFPSDYFQYSYRIG